jgi:hypothetical protein
MNCRAWPLRPPVLRFTSEDGLRFYDTRRTLVSTVTSLFVGFMQQDDTKVTAVTVVLAGVFFSSITSYLLVASACNVG